MAKSREDLGINNNHQTRQPRNKNQDIGRYCHIAKYFREHPERLGSGNQEYLSAVISAAVQRAGGFAVVFEQATEYLKTLQPTKPAR